MAITGATDLGRGLLALTVDTDPQVVAVDCALGCLLIYTATGALYSKIDDGLTTNSRKVAILDANNQLPTSSLPGAFGLDVIDFGTAPGSTNASLVIVGQALILSGSVVRAWLVGTATADHSVDEHFAEAPSIVAGSIVAGVGFTIYAAAPGPWPLYGQYSVGWSWA
jgi:hypothetical protein